jgi:putative spermidine/putrescine transport system ATP-binding protein
VTLIVRQRSKWPRNGLELEYYRFRSRAGCQDRQRRRLGQHLVERRDGAGKVMLELIRLPHIADRAVRSLSGGQQQRVALARALVFEPAQLLLDEPLAALDKGLRDTMQLEIRRIHERTGMTTVAVTHDQVEAMTMSDRVAILDAGRISQVGTRREVYRTPANLFVAGFLGEANLLEARDGGVPALGSPRAARATALR